MMWRWISTEHPPTTLGSTTTDRVTFGSSVINTVSPVLIGSINSSNSDDAMLVINRPVDASKTGNGHAFSDSSPITRTGGIAYNSFDGRVSFSGTSNYDHYAAFQSSPTYGSSGTLTNLYNFVSIPYCNSGTVTNSFGSYTFNPGGSGSITNNYGLYIQPLTRGTSSNYAIYTEGSTKSYFGGFVGIGALAASQRLVVGAGGSGSTSEIMIINSGASGQAATWYEQNSAIRGIFGLSNSSGGIVNQSVLGDFCIRSAQKMLFSANSGTNAHLIIATNGTISMPSLSSDATPSDIVYWNAGVLTHGAKPSGGATNLTYSTTTSTLTVISDTGTDATLPSATQSNAGVLNTVDKTKIDNIWVTTPQSLSGTTVTMTWTSGINSSITLTGTTTLTIEGMPDGGEAQIEVTNGASAYTFNLNGSTGYTTEVVMGNNATINTTISSHTTVVIWRRGSTLYYGFVYNN